MNLRMIIALIAVFSFLACNDATGQKTLKTKQDSLSYAIGMQVGSGISRDSIKINVEILAAAIADVMTNDSTKLKLKEADVQKIFTALSQDIQAKKMEEQKKKGEVSKGIGVKFLNENKSKPGVKVTASGLQYKEDRAGTGKQPTETSTVKVHYKGTLISGKVFDSSYDRGEPIEFPLNGVIKGWTEGLQLMKEGAKFTFYIPSELAYGEMGAGHNIGPNETLIFEVELLEVK